MKVSLHPIPAKYLARMNEPDLSRVMTGIAGLVQEPPQGDIKPMTGQSGVYRLRIGNWRILYTMGDDSIDVFKIARRGQAYKE